MDEDDYDVLADSVVLGRIMRANAAPVDAPRRCTLAFGHHEEHAGVRLRADARGRDGGVRQELAAGMIAAPAHEWFQVKGLIAAKPTTHVRYRGQIGKHLLVLSFTGFDPTRTSTALTNG
jgi:hypothetical protein